MALDLDTPDAQDGQTPLDPDEKTGLIPGHIETQGALAPDELAARFHHALVWIHPFPNGNGRHARMMADALLQQLGRPAFSWGSGANLVSASAVRARYLAALRAADRNDFADLVAFVRS